MADDDTDPLERMVAESIEAVNAQRLDYAKRSRRLNQFFQQTMSEQTGALIRREPVKPVDFEKVAKIVEGTDDEPNEGGTDGVGSDAGP